MAELPLPYVPIDPRIEESERFLDFVEALELEDDPRAIVYVVKLLFFAGRQHVDGNLGSSLKARRLARQCGWAGDPDAFLEALLEAKWIVQQGNDFIIEGWERHGGRVFHDRVRHRKKWGGKGKTVTPSTPVPGNLPEVPATLQEVPGNLPEVPATFPPEGEGEGEYDQSFHPSGRPRPPVQVVERRTVLTETHTRQLEVSERRMDGFDLPQFQEFLADANLAAALTVKQQEAFAALPASNRTHAHFAEGLRRLRERPKVRSPVRYLLSTVGGLPPNLAAVPASRMVALDGPALQAKWRPAIADEGLASTLTTRVVKELERLAPTGPVLADAIARVDGASWDAVMDELRGARGRLLNERMGEASGAV